MSKKKIFDILALVVMLSMITATVNAQPASVNVIDADTLAPEAAPPEPKAASTSKWELVAVEATAIDMTETAVYIVQLQDAPLPSYRGDIKGLAATNPAVRGESKLDANAPASLAYLDYLAKEQAKAIAEVDAALGRSLDILYTYKAALNGFAAEMTAAEAAVVAKLPSVKYIEREHEYTLDTDAGPAWMGAPGLWDGSETGGLPGTYGEGIIIGVIDTGIDPWNPSFLDIGGDSYDHTNPWGADTYVGVCDSSDPSYDATFPCNDKLIGAWGYASVNGGDPRDADGHGSHTASTAGGNFVAGAVITTSTSDVYTANISGVAPHANIVMYAACCTGAALTAAKEQVILDSVDVVNYSIGWSGGTADLWTNIDTQTWLNVRDAGIFVASSAGNDGPAAATMGGPGDSPWMLTVGASSHDRRFENMLTDLISATVPLADMSGEGMTGGYGPAPIVYAGTVMSTNPGCDIAFPAGTFSGEIVVCDHNLGPQYGGRVHKSEMVRDAGGGGFVMVTSEEYGIALMIDTYAVAGLGITYTDGETLKAGIASGGIQTATITGAVKDVDAAYGDIMAGFSSRGPIRSDYFIKPDVTAPGRAIWAAYHQGDGGDGTYTYNVIQGTSMSSPHAAGAAALLKALHPEWTPAQVQAAMMTTARNTVVDSDGTSTATAFEQGAGHIDLGPAAQAGFVLDVTTQEFTDANPATGGDPSALNLASLPNNQCIGTCSWTRVLSSTQDATVSWAASTALYGWHYAHRHPR